LADSAIYEARLNDKLIDIHENKTLKSNDDFTEFQGNIHHNLNLQVRTLGFSASTHQASCLMSACSVRTLLPMPISRLLLQKHCHELQNKHIGAVANNNRRLASSCHEALMNLEYILSTLSATPNKNEENTHD